MQFSTVRSVREGKVRMLADVRAASSRVAACGIIQVGVGFGVVQLVNVAKHLLIVGAV